MLDQLKTSLWKHFGGGIDMLGNAITMWPDDQWTANKRFFYMAYHCLVFLDYYLTIPPTDYHALLPYTLTEETQWPADAIDDVVPDRIYTKQELLDWIRLSRDKCRHIISGLTAEKLLVPWISGTGKMDLELASGTTLHYSVLDILLYNMKHVQHHAAQLNLLLRQTIHYAPKYISIAKEEL